MISADTTPKRVSPVTPADLPEYVKDNLARALIDAARRFYSDPENVRKFEEWKARKAAEVAP
ncbi:MAG: hypothetical protein IJ438_09895 [Clostridia bacterium]|nr:hypothetical protein [Clostridia bacterium]